jgi:glycosyltransferase involved in cell wall biosynthesis
MHVIPNFGMGGAEKLLFDYLIIAKKKEINFVAISLYPNSNSILNKEINRLGLNVKYLNKKSGFDFKIIRELKEIIIDFNPDIIHSHLGTLKYILMTGVYMNSYNFHTIHSIPNEDAKFIDFISNKIAFKLHHFIPVSIEESITQSINKYYKTDKTILVNNGIFINTSIISKSRSKNNVLTIGNIGSFKKAKNHVFIIKVFNELLKLKSSKLILVGTGKLKMKIINLVKKKGLSSFVEFYDSDIETHKYYEKFDVFLMPSIYEGFGLTFLESQSYGVYSVVSEALSEGLIVSNKVARISLKNSIEVWVKSIIEQPIYNHKINEFKKFDINNSFNRMMEVYTETLKNNESVKLNGKFNL